MNHGSLFSGIGGFDLAAEWMGWNNVFHCEWNEFGQRVLKHHFPNSISYADITTTDFRSHRGRINVLTGGFPCQPYSAAGKRLGKADERHLWPEMLRAIQEIQPEWVVGENVFGIVTWNGGLVFDEVQADLEAEGYEVQPYVLPAVSVNAPHRRDRVWFVAHSNRKRESGTPGGYEETSRGKGIQERDEIQQSNQPSGVFRNASNSDNIRGRRVRDQKEKARTQESNELSGSQCGISAEEQYASNSNSNRQQGRGQKDGGKTAEGQAFESNSRNGNGTSSNSECNRQSRKEYGEKESRQYSKESEGSWFQDFPTQPPVCSGNDGFPRELDNITFSKWRNESIKAYGNAVVPQVVYQIFKTIEQYENMDH